MSDQDSKKPTTSAVNTKELPQDRLATTAKDGRRLYLYPTAVAGFFKARKKLVHFVLLLVFLILPWIKINGEPLFLVQIPERNFRILGMAFFAYDTPKLFFVVALMALGLGLFTALFGRVWCGWACPQTVFIESVFRKIEELIEGDAFNRKRLDDGPWNDEKLFKKTTKWVLFILASTLIAHSVLAYFLGPDAVLKIVTRAPSENLSSFIFIAFLTTVIAFDFGWFREQFCVVLCPYGRFQSVLIDNHSIIIAYDEARGEPRKQLTSEPSTSNLKTGDCVNCFRCVQVCPTGIDIRRGTQLECINCTACIDACDDVMTRLNKPKGLIRYTSTVALKNLKTRFIRPRTIAYSLAITVFASILSYLLFVAKPTLALIRTGRSPYEIIENAGQVKEVANRYKIDFINTTSKPLQLRFETQPPVTLSTFNLNSSIKAHGNLVQEVFLVAPLTAFQAGKIKSKFKVFYLDQTGTENQLEEEVTLIGPFK